MHNWTDKTVQIYTNITYKHNALIFMKRSKTAGLVGLANHLQFLDCQQYLLYFSSSRNIEHIILEKYKDVP